MLLGFLRKDGDTGERVPVFLPSHLTCYVGKDAYAAILGREVEGLEPNRRDEPLTEVVPVEGQDIVEDIRKALSAPQAICCLRLDELDEALIGRIAKTFPDESIYVLSPALPPLSGRPVSEIESFGKSKNECFDDFVSDVTGYRPRRKKRARKEGYASHLNERPIHPIDEPIPVPKRTQTPTKIEKEASKTGPVPKPVAHFRPFPYKQVIISHLKRDLPNLAFAVIFVLLTFATTLGYFFLASNSNAFFEITCLIMAILFPILSAIPIGFIYDDNGRRQKPISLFLAFFLNIHIMLVLACSIIVVALSNCYGWDGGNTILYFIFNLTPILWAFLRILADPLLERLKRDDA